MLAYNHQYLGYNLSEHIKSGLASFHEAQEYVINYPGK